MGSCACKGAAPPRPGPAARPLPRAPPVAPIAAGPPAAAPPAPPKPPPQPLQTLATAGASRCPPIERSLSPRSGSTPVIHVALSGTVTASPRASRRDPEGSLLPVSSLELPPGEMEASTAQLLARSQVFSAQLGTDSALGDTYTASQLQPLPPPELRGRSSAGSGLSPPQCRRTGRAAADHTSPLPQPQAPPPTPVQPSAADELRVSESVPMAENVVLPRDSLGITEPSLARDSLGRDTLRGEPADGTPKARLPWRGAGSYQREDSIELWRPSAQAQLSPRRSGRRSKASRGPRGSTAADAAGAAEEEAAGAASPSGSSCSSGSSGSTESAPSSTSRGARSSLRPRSCSGPGSTSPQHALQAVFSRSAPLPRPRGLSASASRESDARGTSLGSAQQTSRRSSLERAASQEFLSAAPRSRSSQGSTGTTQQAPRSGAATARWRRRRVPPVPHTPAGYKPVSQSPARAGSVQRCHWGPLFRDHRASPPQPPGSEGLHSAGDAADSRCSPTSVSPPPALPCAPQQQQQPEESGSECGEMTVAYDAPSPSRAPRRLPGVQRLDPEEDERVRSRLPRAWQGETTFIFSVHNPPAARRFASEVAFEDNVNYLLWLWHATPLRNVRGVCRDRPDPTRTHTARYGNGFYVTPSAPLAIAYTGPRSTGSLLRAMLLCRGLLKHPQIRKLRQPHALGPRAQRFPAEGFDANVSEDLMHIAMKDPDRLSVEYLVLRYDPKELPCWGLDPRGLTEACAQLEQLRELPFDDDEGWQRLEAAWQVRARVAEEPPQREREPFSRSSGQWGRFPGRALQPPSAWRSQSCGQLRPFLQSGDSERVGSLTPGPVRRNSARDATDCSAVLYAPFGRRGSGGRRTPPASARESGTFRQAPRQPPLQRLSSWQRSSTAPQPYPCSEGGSGGRPSADSSGAERGASPLPAPGATVEAPPQSVREPSREDVLACSLVMAARSCSAAGRPSSEPSQRQERATHDAPSAPPTSRPRHTPSPEQPPEERPAQPLEPQVAGDGRPLRHALSTRVPVQRAHLGAAPRRRSHSLDWAGEALGRRSAGHPQPGADSRPHGASRRPSPANRRPDSPQLPRRPPSPPVAASRSPAAGRRHPPASPPVARSPAALRRPASAAVLATVARLAAGPPQSAPHPVPRICGLTDVSEWRASGTPSCWDSAPLQPAPAAGSARIGSHAAALRWSPRAGAAPRTPPAGHAPLVRRAALCPELDVPHSGATAAVPLSAAGLFSGRPRTDGWAPPAQPPHRRHAAVYFGGPGGGGRSPRPLELNPRHL